MGAIGLDKLLKESSPYDYNTSCQNIEQEIIAGIQQIHKNGFFNIIK